METGLFFSSEIWSDVQFLNEGKALRGQMQSFAWADAKLCVGGCNALRWRMQCFALADAMLCVRVGLNWHRNVCPILDKIKGGKTHHTGHLASRKFLLNQYNQCIQFIIPKNGNLCSSLV